VHSGGKLIRRIFEHLNFLPKATRDRGNVRALIFKEKNVERGKWRYLAEKSQSP